MAANWVPCIFCGTYSEKRVCPECQSDIEAGVDPERHKAEFRRMEEEEYLINCCE